MFEQFAFPLFVLESFWRIRKLSVSLENPDSLFLEISLTDVGIVTKKYGVLQYKI